MGLSQVQKLPNVEVMVHSAAYLCAGLDNLLKLHLDKIVVRIDVLLD